MPMTKCILGGFTYPFNPRENTNPAVRAIVPTDTLAGRNYTDWGSHASRREITQTWPAMKPDFFNTLKAKALAGGTLSFVDDDGVSYTVMATPPTYQRKSSGGAVYVAVSFKMFVVSSP